MSKTPTLSPASRGARSPQLPHTPVLPRTKRGLPWPLYPGASPPASKAGLLAPTHSSLSCDPLGLLPWASSHPPSPTPRFSGVSEPHRPQVPAARVPAAPGRWGADGCPQPTMHQARGFLPSTPCPTGHWEGRHCGEGPAAHPLVQTGMWPWSPQRSPLWPWRPPSPRLTHKGRNTSSFSFPK